MAEQLAPADSPVIVHYWQKGRNGTTVKRIRWGALADELASLYRGRRHATAWHEGDQHGEQIGGIEPHPDTGRLTWWCEAPSEEGGDND